MADEQVTAIATDAGLLALWSVDAFADVDGYEAWESLVKDRLPAVITEGSLVPVGVQSDGSFGVRVAIAPDTLTERERRYSVVTSEPYLLVSGGEVCMSAVEAVGLAHAAPVRLTLPAGRYVVRTTLVAWDEEPGSLGPDGRPSADALPDFVVALEAERGDAAPYRTAEATFDPPGQ